MIYLDSAAVVKLCHREAESGALRAWLGDRDEEDWVSSALLEVEAFRAIARHAPSAVPRLQRVLDAVELVPIALGIRLGAQAVQPVTVRSLDAIHLATALELRERISAFVTYDKRLAEAARGAGLTTQAPS
jgi:predicted nucleic acid-binding protein